jgi:hypothetical protein
VKQCPRCHLIKATEEFNLRANGTLTSYCKECQSIVSKDHYEKNKIALNRSRYERRDLERDQIREYIDKQKDAPCQDCGERHPPWAMDFDHRDPSQKSFGIADAVRCGSLERTKEEIAKCDLVCCLCHRYRTHGMKRDVAQSG